MEDFYRLLHTLQSNDDGQRKMAEDAYQGLDCLQKSDMLRQVLRTDHRDFNCGDQTCQEAQKQGAKILAAVLLRKVIASIDSGLFIALEKANLMAAFKGDIIDIFTRPHNFMMGALSQKLANIVADTFVMADREPWPEAVAAINKLAGGELDAVPVEAVRLAMNCVVCFPQLVQPLGSGKIVNLVSKGLSNDDSETQYLAARAACAYLVDIEPNDLPAIMGFGATLDDIMRVIKYSAEDDNDTVLKQFIDVVESEKLAPLLSKGFDAIIGNCLNIMGSPTVDDENKQLALEVIVSMVETFPQPMRKMIKNCERKGEQDPIEGLLNACLAFISDVENDANEGQSWLEIDGEDDTGANSNAITGEAALDRIACALRGSIIVPRITKIIQTAVETREDWRMRYTGLVALAAIAEGCNQNMAKELKKLVGFVRFCDDQNARVKYAAANTIGQLAIDFGDKFCKLTHDTAIVKLCGLLGESKYPRLIGQAAAALVNFCENLPHSIMAKYAKDVIEVISGHMQHEFQASRQFTLQQLITLLAAIAGQLDSDFLPYHQPFMKPLAQIISSTIGSQNDGQYTKLRGKAIECFSIIGLAIGKEAFAPHVGGDNGVMQKMLGLQLTPDMWDDEDETIGYMIAAWARMAKVMGRDFVQYLPSVMPPLLKACKITPAVQVFEDGAAVTIDEEKWSVIRLPNDQSQIGIKTSCIDLKRTAFSMLVCYVKEVGSAEEFCQYNQEVANLAITSLEFYFDEDVRVHAAEILCSLVDHHGLDIWHSAGLCAKFVAAIEADPDETVKPEIMDCFAKSVESLLETPDEIFRAGELEKIFTLVGSYVEEHLANAQQRRCQRNDDDHDDGDEEELAEGAEVDEYILQKVADILHSIFGTQKAAALPYYDAIHGFFVQLIHEDNVFTDRQWALCVFDDIIERCGEASVKYANDIIPHLLNWLSSDIGEIRQACAYGIGILAKAVAENDIRADVYVKALATAWDILGGQAKRGLELAAADREEEREPEDEEFEVEPWDNIVSAMGKILRHTPTLISQEQTCLVLFKGWLQLIEQQGGITGDQEEAEATMSWLHELIHQQSHPYNQSLMNDPDCTKAYLSLVSGLLVSGVLNDDGVEVRNSNIQVLAQMKQQDPGHFDALTSDWPESTRFLFQDTLNELRSADVASNFM